MKTKRQIIRYLFNTILFVELKLKWKKRNGKNDSKKLFIYTIRKNNNRTTKIWK